MVVPKSKPMVDEALFGLTVPFRTAPVELIDEAILVCNDGSMTSVVKVESTP